MKRKLQNRFCELFGADGDIRFYFSPGRVNLIGEHTDYNISLCPHKRYIWSGENPE